MKVARDDYRPELHARQTESLWTITQYLSQSGVCHTFEKAVLV